MQKIKLFLYKTNLLSLIVYKFSKKKITFYLYKKNKHNN